MIISLKSLQIRILLFALLSVLLISCTEKKEQISGLKKDNNKNSDKISSAGIREGDTEFRIEYGFPRRIYAIEKEDLNNDGRREIIVLSILKDSSQKYTDNTRFDMIEVFALNTERKSYEKI